MHADILPLALAKELRGHQRPGLRFPNICHPLNRLLLRACMQIFCLSFGPKSFVVISDPAYAKQILATNAAKYSKGLLSEILVGP
jgi:hypothetical protein